MGWSGSLTESSAVGSSIKLSSDTSETGAYTVMPFTAPRRGIFKFDLMGSGGAAHAATGLSGAFGGTAGKGGATTGYLLLEKDEVVYVGVGGHCSAAFVSSATGSKLSNVAKANVYFVAGGGAQAGSFRDRKNFTGYNCDKTSGGNGGGSSGNDPEESSKRGTTVNGKGGTQSSGGAAGTHEDASGSAGSYGVGGSAGSCANSDYYYGYGGRGGDGYYGGGGGAAVSGSNAAGYGGGGGSGYIHASNLTNNGKTYTNSTTSGGGSDAETNGSATVTYYAKAELPVVFNGTKLAKIIFNGTEISSLIFNGTKLFCERLKRRLADWYTLMWMETSLKASI